MYAPSSQAGLAALAAHATALPALTGYRPAPAAGPDTIREVPAR